MSNSFGSLVSSFVHTLEAIGPPITPQGQLVSAFVFDHIPGNPVSPPGANVSDFVHSLEITGPPITPQGQLVSDFAHHLVNGPPIEPPGLALSDFVHELHNPVPTSIGLSADLGLWF
jgi:hypothetical protein